MTPKRLREACEAAGLEWVGATWLVKADPPKYFMDMDHPALPSYVADRLVAQAKPRDVAYWLVKWAYGEICFGYDDVADATMSAPAETRITAAMIALGHWSEEEADNET